MERMSRSKKTTDTPFGPSYDFLNRRIESLQVTEKIRRRAGLDAIELRLAEFCVRGFSTSTSLFRPSNPALPTSSLVRPTSKIANPITMGVPNDQSELKEVCSANSFC